MELHGGNIYDKVINLDFSISVNPLGLPEKVRKEAIRGVELAEHYPDIDYMALRRAVQDHFEVPGQQVALGNGATELIYACVHVRKPKKALIVGPTFIEYQRALMTIGCAFDYYIASEDDGFTIQRDLLEMLEASNYDFVFLCNPNNPTGRLIEDGLLMEILDYCETKKIQVLLDECFMDFVKEEEKHSLMGKHESYKKLLIVRAFTKAFAMPGLRLGYCVSVDLDLIDRIRKTMPPWNVSVPAQFAGVAAMKEEDYLRETKSFISSERSWMEEQLSRLGMTVIPSTANFILFKAPAGLQKYCLKKNILIRDASSFNGIGPGYYRVGIKKRRSNERLLDVFKEYLTELEAEACQEV